MAEDSKTSARKGKRNTGSEDDDEPQFGPTEALQILNKAIQVAVATKLPVQRTQLFDAGEVLAVLIIKGAHWDGDILAFNTGSPEYTGKTTGSSQKGTE